MSKARELADVIGTQETTENVLQGRRNLIINGAMQVAQRGTSATNSSSAYGQYLSLDRWATYYDETRCQQLSAVIDGSYKNYLLVDGNTAPSNLFFYQKVEFGSRLLSGKTATLSFLAKSTNSTTLRIRGRFYDSATESNAVSVDIDSDTLTSDWVKYSYTFTATDTSADMTRDFMLIFDSDGYYSSGDDIWITEVQLEVGSVATPFEHRSYGEELALCQRYYYADSSTKFLCSYGTGTSNSLIHIDLPVTMRALPSLSYTSGIGGTSYSSEANSTNTVSFYAGNTSTAAPRITNLVCDAEL